MKIAYFVNQYPKVSHSFIRREINALERRGISVTRFAVRSDASELVDPQDKAEHAKTRYLASASFWSIVASTGGIFARQPLRFFNTLACALKLGRRSDRGLLNHVFYFIEACILTKWLEETESEHVHAHFGTNSAIVVYLSRRLGGPPFSFTVHGPEEFDKPEFISLGEKVRLAAFVAAISSYGQSQLFRWVEYSHWHKVKVVHCGLDAAFHEQADTKTNSSRNLVCVGRLCEQKGQLLLVEALANVIARGEKVHLTLAGDGPMRADIESLIQQKNLEKNVTITGWITSTQVREEILKARALVLPSFAEGLPVVIMEAMALRRPVISTYVAGIPELVKPIENGWLVPAGSIELLEKQIYEVLHTKPETLANMGENARTLALERHDVDIEAGKLAEYFSLSIAS